MTKRTTISIPDELHEKMEEWKGKINFSKEFQKCIGEIINKKESYQKRVKEVATMEQIIERLRNEKADSFGNWEDSGKDEGLKWAKTASYDDLQFILRWDGVFPISDDTSDGEALKEYFDELFDEECFSQLLNSDRYSQNWFSEEGELFIKAWREAVSDFWEQIKNKL